MVKAAMVVAHAKEVMAMDLSQYMTVGEVARRLGARPKDVSDLLYRRELRDDLCPLVGGRRLIPETYLDEVEAALRRSRCRLAPMCSEVAPAVD